MINIDKIIISKNNRVVDSNNLFTWKIEYLYNNEVLTSEIIKIDSDDTGISKGMNINEFLNHKLVCCMEFDLDTIEIEELEL